MCRAKFHRLFHRELYFVAPGLRRSWFVFEWTCPAGTDGVTAVLTLLSPVIVPFGSMFAVVALWLGVSLPLTFIGAYSGCVYAVRLLSCCCQP